MTVYIIYCIMLRVMPFSTFIDVMYFPLTQNGATPLYITSQNGHSNVVNILIKNGAKVNVATNVRCS